MTPRDFDGAVVLARLRLIGALLDDLEAVGQVSAEGLAADRMLRHAVERVLGQLVELAVAVNGHVAATRLGKALLVLLAHRALTGTSWVAQATGTRSFWPA